MVADRARRAAHIVLLATGGTLSTTTDADGRSAPTRDGRALATVAGVRGVSIETRDLALRPSWSFDPPTLASIAVAARDAARERHVDGVVVTHGTTTLEYTAFLADLVLDVDTPIVLTGAMRRADDAAPDGPGNLRDAIAVAASPAARGRGALVAFAGRVIAGSRAWKARRSDPDAFVDLGGELGHVRDGVVEVAPRARAWRPFGGTLEARVTLLKVTPGMDDTLLAAAIASDCRGLVLEALPGAGGIPPPMIETLARAAEAIPVAIASRAPIGSMPDPPTGGTGEPLEGIPLLSAGTLTAEQAWLLLMAVLGDEARGGGAASPDLRVAATRERFIAAARAISTP